MSFLKIDVDKIMMKYLVLFFLVLLDRLEPEKRPKAAELLEGANDVG